MNNTCGKSQVLVAVAVDCLFVSSALVFKYMGFPHRLRVAYGARCFIFFESSQ